LQDSGSRWLKATIGLAIAVAVINAVIAGVLIIARFFYSTGRDQVWPRIANQALVKVHPRFDSPWVATLLAGALGIAGCFAPFDLLLVLTGTSMVLLYGFACVGVIAGRFTGRTSHTDYRMPLFPLAPAVGLMALAYILYSEWTDLKVGRPSLIANLLILLVAFVWYLLKGRTLGTTWLMVDPPE
jgi:amino acid transporter